MISLTVGSFSCGLGSSMGDVGINEVLFSMVVVYYLSKAILNTL